MPEVKVTVKTAEEISKMSADDKFAYTANLIGQVSEVMQTESKNSAETREKLEKMGTEITEAQRSVSEFQTVTNEKLEKLTKEQEDEEMKVFDVALKNSKVRKLWGYDDGITKAMYKPRTKFVDGKGYVKTGDYDGMEELMQLNDALFIMGLAKAQTDGNLQNYSNYIREMDSYKLMKFEMQSHPSIRSEAKKALNTSDGSDWVPTAMSAQMIDDLRLELKVGAQFEAIQMPMRSGSYDVPYSGSRRRAYKMAESTDDSSEKIGTATPPSGKLTFTAVKHALRMLVSYEMEEDAIIPMIPLMRREIVQALADAEEDAIVNGDDSTTHMDTGSGITSSDVRSSWKGLRYYGGNGTGYGGNACVDISTLSTSNLRAIRKAMGRFGYDQRQLIWLTSISGYIQMLGLTEVMTLDKYGQNFTVGRGELGRFDGAPIIVSEFVSSEMNTYGIYDGATTTDTIIGLVNKAAFWKAYKGGFMSEQDKDIEVQQKKVVMSRRLDFKRVWTPGDNEDIVGIGYSLTA